MSGIYLVSWQAVESIAIPDSLVDLRLQEPVLSDSALKCVLGASSLIRHLTLRRVDGGAGDVHCYDIGLAPNLRYALSC